MILDHSPREPAHHRVHRRGHVRVLLHQPVQPRGH